MAKATLEYDLNDPDDIMAHLRAVKSLDLALMIWEFVNNTKKGFQHEIEFKGLQDPYELLDRVYEKFWEELNERGINLDELVN